MKPVTRPLVPAALLMAATLAGPGCTRTVSSPAPPPRVLLVGIDGAEWELIRPLAAAGDLPAFRQLLEEGATGDLRSLAGYNSPALWTTILTGRLPAHHGIPGWTLEDERGDPQLVTSNMRRAPTLWEILGAAGLRSTVVGHLATWPATPIEGYLVTNYSPMAVTRGEGDHARTANPLKGTVWEDVPAQVFPPSLLTEVLPLRVDMADVGEEEMRSFISRPPPAPGALEADLLHSLRFAHAADRTYAGIFDHLRAKERTAFATVYFGGVDAVSHRFWRFMDPSLQGASDVERERYGKVIARYYAFVDRYLQRILRDLDSRTTLIVCSDHGFRAARKKDSRRNREYSGRHRLRGVLALYGRGVRRPAVVEDARLVDLAPTILALLGRPAARDMPGRVLAQALDPRLVDRLPAPVATYQALAPRPADRTPRPSPVDEQMLDQLRSLGYVQ
ncbi:MAG: alkaline phosphatase family protein [Acidobacteriota bacterium]|nr:alkaline phosphatase family protein [Acidobacteriota bacterium]